MPAAVALKYGYAAIGVGDARETPPAEVSK
jgi:hypothetical protein